jgi:hypothetical protein
MKFIIAISIRQEQMDAGQYLEIEIANTAARAKKKKPEDLILITVLVFR